MNKIRLPYLLITIAAIILMPTSSSRAQDWETFRNREFKFRFIYPPDWNVATTRGQNVRGSINAPNGKPFGNCNIVVREEAYLSKYTQEEINKTFNQETWTKQKWIEMIGDRFSDPVVYEAKKIKIDNRPAQSAITGYSYETSNIKLHIKSMNFAVTTPGYVWHFTCVAGVQSKIEADKNFKYWEPTFNRIFSSFVFEEGLY